MGAYLASQVNQVAVPLAAKIVVLPALGANNAHHANRPLVCGGHDIRHLPVNAVSWFWRTTTQISASLATLKGLSRGPVFAHVLRLKETP